MLVDGSLLRIAIMPQINLPGTEDGDFRHGEIAVSETDDLLVLLIAK